MNETRPTLAGPGRLSMSGGCMAPMSLAVAFTPEGEEIRVDIDNQWLMEPEGFFKAMGMIPMERLNTLAGELSPLLEAPHVTPTGSTGALSVSVNLPLSTGAVEGGASEMIAGPPPHPMADLIFAFVEEVAFSPGFERNPYPKPGRRRPIPKWLVILSIIAGFYSLMLLLGLIFGN